MVQPEQPFTGEILLAGNHSHFFPGEGECVERPLYSQFSYSQISGGGKGENLVYRLGKVSYTIVFPTPEKTHFFPGGKF